jgi:ribose transport system substrate-binding protein
VVQWCAGINPCTVVIFIGQLQFPFDKLRYETFLSVLRKHANIKVVATGQGNYDRGTSLKAMTDILQAHPHFNVLLSNADQHVEGALIALKSAGWNVKSLIAQHKLYVMGGGGTQEAVAGLRDGTWSADLTYYPVTNGQLALSESHRHGYGWSTSTHPHQAGVGQPPHIQGAVEWVARAEQVHGDRRCDLEECTTPSPGHSGARS